MYERRVRVIYPLEGGRIVLSTGPAWDVHLEPEAVSDNGHQFEFTVRWAWASRLHLPVQLFSGKVARASQHFGRAERPPDAA